MRLVPPRSSLRPRSPLWLPALLVLLLLGCTSVEPEAPPADPGPAEGAPPLADLSDDAPGGVGEVARFLKDPAVPPPGEQEGVRFKRGGQEPPPCGQPITDPRTGRQLAFAGHPVYSNGWCTGRGTSCGRSYSAQTLADRKAEDPAGARCYDSAGRAGAQPAAVDRYDPTRSQFLNKWQCVEYVNRVFAAEWQVYGWDGHGGQKLETAPAGVTVYYNGRAGNPSPVPGDAIVYGGGAYGHVALVSRVEGDRVYVIGQNEALFERLHRFDARSGTLATDSALGMAVRGWAHADANGRPAAAPAPPPGGLPADDWGDCTVHQVRGRCVDAAGCDGLAEPGHCPGPANIQCCVEVRRATPVDEDAPRAEASCRDHGWRCSDDRSYRYRCEGGAHETERCGHGCRGRLFGEAYCEAPAAPAASEDGCNPNRNRNWACDDQGRRFRCEQGRWAVQQCANGCERNLFGEDRCVEGQGAAPPAGGDGCDDSCRWAGDGECDDGGPGAQTSACAYGTDCRDCGARGGAAPPPRAVPVETCADSCPWAGDGECDDGGPGADTDVCGYGTDCRDCGRR